MAAMDTVRQPLSAWRDRCLRELGVLPLQRRQVSVTTPLPAQGKQRVGVGEPRLSTPPATATVVALASPLPSRQKVPLLVILPAGAASQPRQQTLLRNALLALPAEMQRAPWLEANAAKAQIGAAQACLVLGREAAVELERTVSREASDRCLIVHADAPSDMLAEPARKRSLWLAVKTLLRGRLA